MMAVLSDARKAAGLSQRALSDRLGKPHNFINLVERGQRMLEFCEWMELVEMIGADPARLVKRITERMGRR